jgi:hypothetical protein
VKRLLIVIIMLANAGCSSPWFLGVTPKGDPVFVEKITIRPKPPHEPQLKDNNLRPWR